MDRIWKETIWRQLGAAVDTLEGTLQACPEVVWSDRWRRPEFWYTVFHTLFWLDYYLSDSPENFSPPPPFGIEEFDPAGVLPPRVYTKAELQSYLDYGRGKCRRAIAQMSDEQAAEHFRHGRMDLPRAELLLYVMRHVQHHAAQLNLILRQTGNLPSPWVRSARTDLGDFQ